MEELEGEISKPGQLVFDAVAETLLSTKACKLLENYGGCWDLTRMLIFCKSVCQALGRFPISA